MTKETSAETSETLSQITEVPEDMFFNPILKI